MKDVKLEDEEEDTFKKKPKVDGPLIAKRMWTNTKGKKISASVISLEDEEITFKLSTNRKLVKYDLNKLITDDQAKIKTAAAERLKEIEANEEDEEE